MEVINKVVLDNLTRKSVSVVEKTITTDDSGNVGVNNVRKAYSNSPIGRELIESVLSPENVIKVFEVWGSEPVVEDPPKPEGEDTSVPTKEKSAESTTDEKKSTDDSTEVKE